MSLGCETVILRNGTFLLKWNLWIVSFMHISTESTATVTSCTQAEGGAQSQPAVGWCGASLARLVARLAVREAVGPCAPSRFVLASSSFPHGGNSGQQHVLSAGCSSSPPSSSSTGWRGQTCPSCDETNRTADPKRTHRWVSADAAARQQRARGPWTRARAGGRLRLTMGSVKYGGAGQ